MAGGVLMQHTPTTHPYRAPSEHNGAAILSLVCALLWPLCICILYVANLLTGGNGAALTEQAYFILASGFSFLPAAGIIAGGIGIYRAVKQPLLRQSLWLAVVGLLLGCLWLIGLVVLSDAGPALIYWISHLIG
jgi:hypothetical protein